MARLSARPSPRRTRAARLCCTCMSFCAAGCPPLLAGGGRGGLHFLDAWHAHWSARDLRRRLRQRGASRHRRQPLRPPPPLYSPADAAMGRPLAALLLLSPPLPQRWRGPLAAPSSSSSLPHCDVAADRTTACLRTRSGARRACFGRTPRLRAASSSTQPSRRPSSPARASLLPLRRVVGAAVARTRPGRVHL